MERGELELPDWNVALQEQQDSFDCSPVKQPLVQVKLKDGNRQRVTAIGRPKAEAAAGSENALAVAAAPRSVRRTHTPTRTGLTAKPVRLPSRLGHTPGNVPLDQFEVPPSAQAAAAPAATGGVRSILKRLNFSTTKARRQAAAGASAAPAPGPPEAGLSTAGAPPPQAESTIKQLRFDAGATPGAGTGPRPGPHRHVTFDAATVSPAPRPCAARGPAPGSAALPRTPAPPVIEEEEVGGSVNSAGAGHTPFDRRLSSLFRKYQVGGTPELADDELDELLADAGAPRSPSWNRLSSSSVPDSIRELAKRYDGTSRTPTLSPAPPAGGAAQTPGAAGPGSAASVGTGGSPALDPTPHHVLDSVMKRNALYESPPAAAVAAAGAAPADAAATSGPQPLASPPSPTSALAALLAPVLTATIRQMEGERAAAAQDRAIRAPVNAASPGSAAATSPADFYGFPRLTPGKEAASAASSQERASDGVPRDSEGVPRLTPPTVTVRRGSYGLGLGGMLEGDGLATQLFTTFSPDAGGGSPAYAFSPADTQPQASPPSAGPAAAAAAAEAASPEFSFFPAAASRPSGAAGPAPRSADAAGATPEVLAAYGQGGTTISPEILGFHESQAQQRQVAAEGAAASQAGGLPVLPKSIIKSGRPVKEGGSPVLGHAQRGGPQERPAPPAARELQALMADLRLEDAEGLEQMGTLSTLSPVRATSSLRGILGGLARAITPVRRSARKMAATPHRPLEAMLEEADFSYVPNAALMAEDAQPRLEAAAAKAAKRAVSRATSQCSEATLAGGAPAAAEQAEVSSEATPSRRYSTRSAARAAEAQHTPAGTPAEDAQLMQRRLSLRRVRTPLPEPAGGGATPRAALPGANTPVAQDASPHLADSPSFADTPLAAAAAGRRSYSLRASTLKKSSRSRATPAAAAALAPDSEGSAGGEQPQLSPTERGIRAALRRSARKSEGPQ